ncbi:MAG: cell division protein ZapE, partial [Methylobacter sp.]
MLKKPSRQTTSNLSQAETRLLEKQYNDLVAQGHIQYESAQITALKHLQNLLDNVLANFEYEKKSTLHKLF